MTFKEAAESLYGAMTPGVSAEVLGDYGIDASAEEARAIAREVCGLRLYWIADALDMFQRASARPVLDGLRSRITQAWRTELGQDGEPTGFFSEWDARRGDYDRLNREGGGPLSLVTASIERLEASGVRPELRRQMLAFLVDAVPVDEFGELVQELPLPQ